MVQHLRDAPHFRFVARTSGLVHEHPFAYQLGVVLVGGNHVNGEPLFFGAFGERAHHVIRLVARHRDARDAHALDNPPDVRDGLAQAFRHGGAVRLVGVEHLVPESRSVRVEDHRHVCRVFFLEQFQQEIAESECGGGIDARRRDARIVDESVVGTVNQRVSVQQEKGFGAVCHDGVIKIMPRKDNKIN